MFESLKIVALCVVAAIAYGIAHDLVTAHVCVEYFSIGHKNLFAPDTAPAWKYALCWGVIATWWMGFGLGIVLALCARFGREPRISFRQMVKPVLISVAALWLAAMLVLAGSYMWLGEDFRDARPIGKLIPPENHRAYHACRTTHNFSYYAAATAALTLGAATMMRRRKLAKRGS